ncbi:MAG: hypothetical protein Q9191_002079 [Dirinaria sp. TL-2023a]
MARSTADDCHRPSLRQQSFTENVASNLKTRSARASPSPSRRGRIAKLESFHLSPSSQITFRAANIKRWDGRRRTTVIWDGLRKDSELWFADGDCLVHFYGRGQSKRGASLRVPFAKIQYSNCMPLFQRAALHSVSQTPSPTSSEEGSPVQDTHRVDFELYLPAPPHLSREDAFRYHLTTRNFFAWMFEKPVVGHRLGESLVALYERMNEYRPCEEQNRDDILAYIDGQEYSDFRDCPDHALAVLHFAERFEIRELWTDAFVHCAGMNNELASSAEFEVCASLAIMWKPSDSFQSTSRMSKALITRAHLEMDLRLEHAGQALSNFLEDDMSGSYLGLSQDARTHLERFRSFLHSFYVQKYGYWPPPQTKRHSKALPKSIYRVMYIEIRNLYEYLVDPASTDSFQNNRLADGGVCVLQNIKTFDKRHKYITLPHALPLLPQLPREMAGQKSHGLAKFFGSKQLKLDRRLAASAALSAATNPSDISIMKCRLVREYLKFEKNWSMNEEERITCADARKVRWILVYAMLQTLVSVTRAPKEVRDTEGVDYPLCCQIAGTPPWTLGKRPQPFDEGSPKPTTTIKPDTDYFTPKPASSPLVRPQPVIALPHKISFPEGLSVHSPQPQKAVSCDMLLNGYRLSTNTAGIDSDPSTPSSTDKEGSSGWDSNSDSDTMEHASVNGSVSFYGDDEDTKQPHANAAIYVPKKLSISSFQQSALNPEVERYILS